MALIQKLSVHKVSVISQVGGLYINIQYENHEMICVTGTSMKQFTLDRTLENEWDENVKKFLKKNGVVFS